MNEDTSKAERLHDYRTKVALLKKENAELKETIKWAKFSHQATTNTLDHTKNQFNEVYRDFMKLKKENAEVKASIDAIVDDKWKDGKLKLGQLACANNATRRNQIKAEGIREMVTTLRYSGRVTSYLSLTDVLILEYADKLEQSDETP